MKDEQILWENDGKVSPSSQYKWRKNGNLPSKVTESNYKGDRNAY